MVSFPPSTDNLEDDGFVVIETPGFPAQYPPNLDQMWFFRANKGFRIELLVFELEDDSDFLYILSGFSGFAPPSINFLSGTLPEGTEYYIYDQSMQLHATSDDFFQRRGFRINVTAYDNTTSGGKFTCYSDQTDLHSDMELPFGTLHLVLM